ncbi:hypothetical protein J2X46_002268 [Nocardioides sp. BE266]|uniref:hypothetical protein n=1 Tax=Nocardioides sp. BE266 TaxID=2817725 RepID=UPI002858D126|nr:hypothetical protein [Nocardioides sp. BE266]MDR7253283.1 hypothetical protein [Nocardioides sp. BE266]
MKWLVGGLVIGAVIAGVLLVVQGSPARACPGSSVTLHDAPNGGPPEGERDPAAAAGWSLDSTDQVESEPETPGEADDRITYYSYDGRDLAQIVVVERGGRDRWFATADTTCE